jgi:hypothetical protein
MTTTSATPAPTTGRRLRRESWGFIIGSALFFVGALPFYAAWAGTVWTDATFFVGSLFFTAAGFIQLSLSGRRLPLGSATAADRTDWWAAAVQFVGTLLFNVSTVIALIAAVERPSDAGLGWRPDAWGSAAFLASSVLALFATKDRGQLWDLDARTWHGTTLNLIGSVAFAASAAAAYVLPATGQPLNVTWVNLGTAVGAVCFLVAAVLARRNG